jgi:dTDP-4-dehydrorhamnose 3,5-epimerase
MQVIPTALPGVTILEPRVFGDVRGYFLETWNRRRYSEAGVAGEFFQDNLAHSRRGVLRGLHVQQPHAQGKLVGVLQGEVFDVAVDIRRGSPSFGQWTGVRLSAENHRQLWVPEGFAHGYCVLSEEALFVYKCTDDYHPESQFSVLWNDPDLPIAWPLECPPSLADKDRSAPRLRDIPLEQLPIYPG